MEQGTDGGTGGSTAAWAEAILISLDSIRIRWQLIV